MLYRLYNGQSRHAIRFGYGMMAFDLITIAFFIVSSMVDPQPWFVFIDFIVGIVIGLDFLARFWLARRKARYLTRMTTLADVIVVISLLAPAFVEHLIFLRVLRALRLLRSFHILQDLRKRNVFFRMHEDIIQSVLNLFVFLFIVTALVYVMQVRINDSINNYMDALYFTVATLTTTGFGDVTLQGQSGHFLAIIIMVVGITLFLRLVQTIFRPPKVKFECPTCGLNRHDTDAVHCKHCGEILKIETEGA
ncbi:MAG TPA: potassium channel protein [Hellea balneolensis]|uniref:Potassium channel protein n=1 Tax=Hellea balneolensis TaxID=287478 RepID=A0A7C5QXD6_9PROT|nr:potassium channel protein [Hellea balneolensis]